ncbi:biotin-dependent carboxyltransferase family protein [Neisseria yangbaofengii]|uniref:5-oxoprolinase subunit C family protein n=1 Tax=Neisseria yangbaofengii TaxID=2709396 RepID=UPI0013E9B914|nr:biotin-dependent carboxyltransferase family protein [Neisseria yangbaofengii]
MIDIQEVTALAHVQDLGRYGRRRFGIGHAGAMDTQALQAGNILLGNLPGAAAIEVVLGGLSVRFGRDTPFCITGAVYEADLDGEPVYSYWRYTAEAGQTLYLKRAVQGMYGYLCVAGGIDVPEVMGSRSTDLKAAFGGFEGRALHSGDILPQGAGEHYLSRVGIAPLFSDGIIHALPSSEYHLFDCASRTAFWNTLWRLQSDSNRMGYRFSGAELNLAGAVEMLSHAVTAGTVQVPPSGLPIVLTADCQTTGGYPKIACVAAADLGKLAQTRFGSAVRFRMTDTAHALRLQRKNQAYLNHIKRIAGENS